MRRSDWLAAMLATATLGCAWPLDHEFDDASAPAAGSPGDAGPSVAPGCLPLKAAPGVSSIAGDVRSLALADGGSIWIADQAAVTGGGAPRPTAFEVSAGADTSCASWGVLTAGAALAPSPLQPDGLVAPLDLVATAAGPALDYQLFAPDPGQPLGLRALGVGLAPMAVGADAGSVFAPTLELLWSADRPTYGGSAWVLGDTVYVWGCKGAAALTSDCFVARAPIAQVGSQAAYAYWAGDHWSSSADDATAIAQGGSVVSVRPDAARPARWLMTYVPPLGDALFIRSAVAPEGPWSDAVPLASCALAGAGSGAFCAGGQQHPVLAAASGGRGSSSLSLTYDARTFAPDAGGESLAFWPRLVSLAVPAALP